MARYASVYFAPRRGAVDVVIGFIDRCNTSLDVAVYSITQDTIADALVRAHGRGVKVRVLTDHLQASNRYADDERLEAEGIPLRRDTQNGFMHHKFMIGDGNAVATGSYNWTSAAELKNAENFVVLRLSYIVAEFQAEYEAIWLLNDPA